MGRLINSPFLTKRLAELWEKLETIPPALLTVPELIASFRIFSVLGKPAESVDLDELELLETGVSRALAKSDVLRKALKDMHDES